MSKANGLALVPDGERGLAAGSEVTVQMLDWPEGSGCPAQEPAE
jgi:molybdopterin biosynthesis enzyme